MPSAFSLKDTFQVLVSCLQHVKVMVNLVATDCHGTSASIGS